MLPVIVVGAGIGAVHAQPYPSKPIRLHTAGIGGTSDTVARMMAAELAAPLGQSLVVENFAGNVLVPNAARLAPDGYTLLVTGGNLWIRPLFEKMTYDPVRDFTTIVTMTRQSTILAVHPSLPVRSVADLIKLAKARPGELNYSSGTTGASSHIAAELFNAMAGASIVRVVYKATAQEVTDLLSGQVHMTFGNGPTMGPLGKAGKLRALATAGGKRSVLFPELPTVGETLPGYVAEQLVGLFAPGRPPEGVVNRMNQVSVRMLERPEVRDRLLKVGLEPVGGSPDDFAAAIRAEMTTIGKLIKEIGIKSGE